MGMNDRRRASLQSTSLRTAVSSKLRRHVLRLLLGSASLVRRQDLLTLFRENGAIECCFASLPPGHGHDRRGHKPPAGIVADSYALFDAQEESRSHLLDTCSLIPGRGTVKRVLADEDLPVVIKAVVTELLTLGKATNSTSKPSDDRKCLVPLLRRRPGGDLPIRQGDDGLLAGE